MDNIEKFKELMGTVKRPGIENLMKFLEIKSDFYKAPASTIYHSCHEGGLLEHSLNVFNCMCDKVSSPTWKNIMPDEESIIITTLLHDVCKVNFYTTEYRNKKIYSDNGKKYDSNGRYDWVSVPGYAVNDTSPYGHGEKSVMMISEFMKLKPVELYAIRWHMGFTEPKESWKTLTAAIKKYPYILALHEADLEATYILEEDG